MLLDLPNDAQTPPARFPDRIPDTARLTPSSNVASHLPASALRFTSSEAVSN